MLAGALAGWLGGGTAGNAMAQAPSRPLDACFQDDGLWSRAPADFMARYGALGFRWTEKNVSARAAGPGLALLGLRVWETLVDFEDGKPKGITFSIYNRGDAGHLDAPGFEKLLKDTARALDAWSPQPGGPAMEIRGPTNVKLFRRRWAKPPHLATLEWSFTPPHGSAPFRAEFARLQLTHTVLSGPAATLGEGSLAGRAPLLTVLDLRARVQHRDNGDVYIKDVPMVDQGHKGYCAAAVAERVMRYFGRDFDQHQVAQVASTSASRGTSMDQIAESMRRIATRFDLNFRTLFELDKVRDYEHLIKDYNRQAKREKKPQIECGLMINVPAIYHKMDPKTLEESRRDKRSEFGRLRSKIRENVNTGIPLLWSCQLGLYKEKPDLHQAFGGHMRIIIGYNDKDDQVLYTDTWGAGHELKRLPTDEAWAMTTGLYVVIPRNIH